MQSTKSKVTLTGLITPIIISFFLLLLTLPNMSYSQQNSFVYLENGKFMLNGNEYFPLAINYAVDIVKDINGQFHISPHAQYCKWSKCEGEKSGFYCGTNISEWNSKIRKHVDKIADMGFNSIRLVGVTTKYNPEKMRSNKLVSDFYRVQNNPEKLECFVKHKGYKINRKTINGHVDLYEIFVKIIREHNTAYPDKPLKVILTTGTGGLQNYSWLYAKLMTAIGERFKNDPTVFAYEPNFEGFYLGIPVYEKNQKYERAENFAQWYYALKEVAPSQLVTYGVQLQDVFNWDPQTFPVDFISLHKYPVLKHPYSSQEFERYKSILKWFSESYDIPWIIGETGLAGNDVANKKNEIIVTEEQQKEFAYSSLAYAQWYGGIGYAWWQYKEVPWKKITDKKPQSNFYGLVRMKDEKERTKPAVQAFLDFDPSAICNTCYDPDPEIYYNPYGYKFLNIKGTITTPQGKPVKNAYIVCKSKKGNYYTFSNEKGEFNVYTKPNDDLFTLRASYPGMTLVELSQWGGPKLKSDLNLKIEYLDKSRLPIR